MFILCLFTDLEEFSNNPSINNLLNRRRIVGGNRRNHLDCWSNKTPPVHNILPIRTGKEVKTIPLKREFRARTSKSKSREPHTILLYCYVDCLWNIAYLIVCIQLKASNCNSLAVSLGSEVIQVVRKSKQTKKEKKERKIVKSERFC